MTDGSKPRGERKLPPDEGRERWRASTRRKAVEAAPERRERFETSSGIEIQDRSVRAIITSNIRIRAQRILDVLIEILGTSNRPNRFAL